MQLDALARPERIFPALDASDGTSILRQLAQSLVDQGLKADADELLRKLLEREQLSSTGIGQGVAIPHCKLARLDSIVLAIGLCNHGVDFGAVDALPVRLFFLVVSPNDQPAEHLQCLAAISRWVKDQEQVKQVLELEDPQAIYELLRDQGG